MSSGEIQRNIRPISRFFFTRIAAVILPPSIRIQNAPMGTSILLFFAGNQIVPFTARFNRLISS